MEDALTLSIDGLLAKLRPACDGLQQLGENANLADTRAAVQAFSAIVSTKLDSPEITNLAVAYEELIEEFRWHERQHSDEVDDAETEFGYAEDMLKAIAEFPQEYDAETGHRAAAEYDATKARLEEARATASAVFRPKIEPKLAEFDRLARLLIWNLEASLPSQMARTVNSAVDEAGTFLRSLFGK